MGNIISRFCTWYPNEQQYPDEQQGNPVAVVEAAATTTAVCAVCLDDTVDTVFIPCGHICACLGCLRRMEREALLRQWGRSNLQRSSIRNFQPTLHCPICRCEAHGYRIFDSQGQIAYGYSIFSQD